MIFPDSNTQNGVIYFFPPLFSTFRIDFPDKIDKMGEHTFKLSPQERSLTMKAIVIALGITAFTAAANTLPPSVENTLPPTFESELSCVLN